MFVVQCKDYLLVFFDWEGRVVVKIVVDDFGVLEDVIWCDLCEFVEEGRFFWVYGGVLLIFVVELFVVE